MVVALHNFRYVFVAIVMLNEITTKSHEQDVVLTKRKTNMNVIIDNHHIIICQEKFAYM
jgi:hypothetical protein